MSKVIITNGDEFDNIKLDKLSGSQFDIDNFISKYNTGLYTEHLCVPVVFFEDYLIAKQLKSEELS